MKIPAVLTLLLTANVALAQSDFLDRLKNTPATQYDLAKLQLQMSLNRLTQELQGQAVGNTGFSVQTFRLEEQDERLTIVGRLQGPANRVDQARCQEITRAVRQAQGLQQVARSTWPGLSPAQYQEIDELIAVDAELVAQDNPEHGLRCQ